MVCKPCPLRTHCFDKGSCESCDLGKAFEGYNLKIKRLKEKNKALKNENDALKARIDVLLHKSFRKENQL